MQEYLLFIHKLYSQTYKGSNKEFYVVLCYGNVTVEGCYQSIIKMFYRSITTLHSENKLLRYLKCQH